MIFDLHCHPSFKTFLGNRIPEKRKDCWESVDFDVDLNILDSQSSLTQLKTGKAKIIVANLYGLENAFAKSGLIKLAAGLSKHAEKRFLQAIEKEKFGYFELMMGDYEHLAKSQEVGPGKTFKIIKSFNEYDENSDQIHALLAVEGGHNFYDDKQNFKDTNKVLENLRFFKNPANPRILYITLTHLAQSAFCTHAYGMKLIRNNDFYPAGKGLNNLGKTFIREALSNGNGPRIFIDIKHMSINSRLEYYQLRKNEFPNIPIIASHMGVTGLSYKNKTIKKVQANIKDRCIEVHYYRNKGVMDTYFNPWSINLYDEDIREIMNSRGLIGLSLDQRILGAGNVSKEVFSMQEFKSNEFQPIKRPSYHRLNPEHYKTVEDCKNWHIRHFLNNYLHIIKIGLDTIGEEAWNHVCIGSDFDGLIDPIDDMTSAANYQVLPKKLTDWFPLIAARIGILLSPHEIKEKVQKLLFDNAVNFLKTHYQ